jgi:hypothetical protein
VREEQHKCRHRERHSFGLALIHRKAD